LARLRADSPDSGDYARRMVHTSELLQVAAFVGLIAITLALAATVLARRYLTSKRTPIRGWARIVVVLAALGCLCFAYGRCIEPRWIETTQTRVPTTRLPAGHRGVRIVHLSDIHSDPQPLVENRLPTLIADLHPDLIVFTGDCANSEAGFPVFRKLFADLARIAPTFVVRGNWDPRERQGMDIFAGLGVTELDGSSASIDVAGARVHVVGLAHQSPESRLGAALAALPAEGLAIVLDHTPYPDIVPPGLASRVDLMCAGHVHGGQVALPFYGAILTLSKHGKRFERGLYPDADGFGFPLYVSRGIGMEGGTVLRVRFCSRPEIAVIELAPVAGSN
ncbi:MAG: metallophosphoesterase, partial [Planctomycetota bacterium]